MPRTRSGMYRGLSAEQRDDERRRALKDAMLQTIGTKGWAQTTVRGVCATARVGPRFFYVLYEDLEALAGDTLDEVVATAMHNALQAMIQAPDDVPAKTRAALASVITELTEDPHRARLVFAEAHASDTLMRRRLDAMRRIADIVATQADTLLKFPAGEQAILRAMSLLVTGGVAELVLVWLEGDLDLTLDGLIDICVESLLEVGKAAPAIAARLTATTPTQTTPRPP